MSARSGPRFLQRWMEDPRKREILFKAIWMGSLGMLVLGYIIIAVLLAF